MCIRDRFIFTPFASAAFPLPSLLLGLATMFVAGFALIELCNGRVSFAGTLQTKCCEILGCRKHHGVFSGVRAMFVGFWAFVFTVNCWAIMQQEAAQKAEVIAATEQVADLIEAIDADLANGRISDSKEKLEKALAIECATNKSDLASLQIKVARKESQQRYKEGMKLLKQGKLDAAKQVVLEASKIRHANNDQARTKYAALSLANDKKRITQAVSKLNKDEFEAVVSAKRLPEKYLLGIEEFDSKTNMLLVEILPEAKATRARQERDRKERAEQQRLRELVEKEKRRKAAEERRLREEAAARKAANEIDFNGVVLIRNSVQGTSDQITGQVENRKGRTLRYVEIKYNLYDTSGAHVGTAFTNTTGLENGRVWKFQAHILGKEYSTFKLNELSGY